MSRRNTLTEKRQRRILRKARHARREVVQADQAKAYHSSRTADIKQGPFPHEGMVRCTCGWEGGVWAISAEEFPAEAEAFRRKHLIEEHDQQVALEAADILAGLNAEGV